MRISPGAILQEAIAGVRRAAPAADLGGDPPTSPRRSPPTTTLARVAGHLGTDGGTRDPPRPPARRPERNGILTVTCAAAVWAQELDLMASEA